MKELRDNSGFPASSARLPKPYAKSDVTRGMEQWCTQHPEVLDPPKPLLEAVFGNSPYLSHLLLQYPAVLRDMTTLGADETYAQLMASFRGSKELMVELRIAKGKLALLVALADMAGIWPLERVTAALSGFAERCLSLAVDSLLHTAYRRGTIILPHLSAPSRDSGVIVLGMGKLGGRELNYSSNIDLILFFEPGRLRYQGRQNEQHFMNKLAHDLASIMQERSAQGYVFRTDLRLRPDPASTPPAIATEAACYYYESVGQNWERAAMIKARPVAGDIQAGEHFLLRIAPFMWRRHLDFAAINDIHSIKRQMDANRNKDIQIKGHNIKLGVGGIREIEFYAQIHQLIWGGREPRLRSRATCETLKTLMEMGLIDAAKEKTLREAYVFLRTLEHRLQMVADEQTHTLPANDEGIDRIACFMGYENVAAFEKDTLHHLNHVHDIYASSFKSAEHLGDEGNLVFTGVSHDPETLETLRKMGYEEPERVSEIVMGWHHGSTRATRSKRARELLTELMPLLLKRLGETAHPDTAFLKFNEFLSNLPSGVQLFSLFATHPHLLGLIASIMGSAPTLAEHLSKSPALLDAVLYEDFYGALPPPEQLSKQLDETLANTSSFEEHMDTLRRFRNEKQFQAGVQLLGCAITAQQSSLFLSNLADVVITKALTIVIAEFARSYGVIAGSRFAVIALGKLGSHEMTFGSDIDLIFIYDAEDADLLSDGAKPFSASVYYNRLAQRFLGALTAMGRDGRLYEVDTRLRPSGEEGLLAVSMDTLAHYFDELAWTFETMAMTKARAISGDDLLRQKLDAFIREQIARPRDMDKLKHDATDMRNRIEKEHGTHNPWDIKYVRGGLMDCDFIAQYLMLRHAPDTPGANPGSAQDIFEWLKRDGHMETMQADALIEASCFLGQVFNMLRLCCDQRFDENTAPSGLKKLLAEAAKEKDFESLKQHLIQVEHAVHEQYSQLLTL